MCKPLSTITVANIMIEASSMSEIYIKISPCRTYAEKMDFSIFTFHLQKSVSCEGPESNCNIFCMHWGKIYQINDYSYKVLVFKCEKHAHFVRVGRTVSCTSDTK